MSEGQFTEKARAFACCPHCAEDPLHDESLHNNHTVDCDLCEYEKRTPPRLERTWDEACQALAWALDNGPAESAVAYVLANNPHRHTSTGSRDTTDADT